MEKQQKQFLHSTTLTDREAKLAELRANSKHGVGIILGEEFDVMAAVGGIRGIIESIVPTIVFLVSFVVLHEHILPALIALAVCVVFILLRLIQRIAVTPALGGLFAMAISVLLAWRSGEASDMFLWGILINILYFAVLAISVLAKWPLIGVAITFFKNDSMNWRKPGVAPIIRRCYYQITWLWVGAFALRLLVQLPLYLAKQTEALGIVKLAMGLPLFALILWFSWLLYRSADNAQELADLQNLPAQEQNDCIR